MRKQLAVFETDLDDDDFLNRILEYNNFKKEYNVQIEKEDNLTLYEEKLKVFTAALNTFHDKPKYFENFLSKIKAKFLPKNIKDDKKESKIITNKRTADKYVIERSSVFIDAPIEIHLISVLWILKKGVDLDRELFEGSLGNRLILNKEKDKVVQGSGLFKPYPKQYQKWRDDAVKAAKEQLGKKEDVLIVNLDIRDFFYSVRMPKEDIIGRRSSVKRKKPNSLDNLYYIFGKIHEVFTEQISYYKTPYDFKNEITDDDNNIEKYILPIGLLSSFVIANNYLKEFDKRIIKHSRPVYYGRYVDDILLVISNPVLPEDRDKKIKELNFNYEQYLQWINGEKNTEEEILNVEEFDELLDVEQYVLLNFHPHISLINKPAFLYPSGEEVSNDDRVFKLNGFERLYCQSNKTLLYYFDRDESALVIDKLKRDLEEKSSEFRNYTDAEDAEDFEESAYHLLYDGTEGKIRTLKDYKEDKFGLTVYLSKRIFNSLRRADKISNAEAEKIVRFFQGSNTLTLYTLWERIFVFLLVNDKAQAYVQFYLNCCEAIKRIELSDIGGVINRDTYQSHVLEHLDSSNELALSLYPRFLSEVQKVKRIYQFSFNALKNELEFYRAKYSPTDENSFFISRYRRSNLIRHHYVAQPLLSYTKTIKKDYKNYTDLKIHF
ncbi:MAG TPA: hypothetical protein PLS00_00685 [Niabella sp.]|nr:hypothetical protein [Niabella sp.]